MMHFMHKEGIFQGIGIIICEITKVKAKDVLKQWKVKENSVLENKLITNMLIQSIAKDRYH